jgi:acetyl-CoA synthetase
LRFFGRSDDVIKSSGYRIGPAEIEDCLMSHPAVSNVAAIGVPDELRGEIVKVYIVLTPETIAQHTSHSTRTSIDSLHASLRASLAAHVKGKLAAYEYPREIEFIDALPMTTTGKVIRKDLKTKHMAEQAAKKGK